MDNESYSNYCSARVVLKLNLLTIPHPKPYKLHWINEDGGIIVSNQVNNLITLEFIKKPFFVILFQWMLDIIYLATHGSLIIKLFMIENQIKLVFVM